MKHNLQFLINFRFLSVDLMHNAFLGTAKRIWYEWRKKPDGGGQPLLNDKDVELIDERLEELRPGLDDRWVCTSIGSNAPTWTAHEWKMWTLVASAYCLQGILKDTLLQSWQHFVMACRYLSQPTIDRDQLQLADQLMIRFLKECEKHYDHSFLTVNMHLHCHLKECIEDFSSSNNFWLFSYERYNGYLGDIPSNKRNVEPQLMKRFLLAQRVHGLKSSLPDEFSNDFARFCPEIGQVETTPLATCQVPEARISACEDVWDNWDGLTLEGKPKTVCLAAEEKELLLQTYKLMYPSHSSLQQDFYVPSLAEKYTGISLGAMRYASKESVRKNKFAWVHATWFGESEERMEERPCIIKYYLRHSIVDNSSGQSKHHCFAVVQWFRKKDVRSRYIRPLTLWEPQSFERPSRATFLPVLRISGRFGALTKDGVFIVAPVTRSIYM